MNNYVRKIASEYNIPINKITIKNNTRIIDDKIVLKKKKNNDLNNVYKYLKSRSFDYFPEPITIDNLYEVYPFLEDTYEPSEQKATDIMHLLGLLHSKTTFYREIDIDKNKEIYENISDELEDLLSFYKNHYLDFDFDDLFHFYESGYPLKEDERLLLFTYMAIPYKIEIMSDEYEMCIKINKMIEYLYKTSNLIMNYHS